jgi:hypothetical protein
MGDVQSACLLQHGKLFNGRAAASRVARATLHTLIVARKREKTLRVSACKITAYKKEAENRDFLPEVFRFSGNCI